MDQFHREHPEYSRGLLTFVMEFVVANKWPGNVLMRLYNDCDTECTIGQTEPCGCTCTIDPFEMGDDEVRNVVWFSCMNLHPQPLSFVTLVRYFNRLILPSSNMCTHQCRSESLCSAR